MAGPSDTDVIAAVGTAPGRAGIVVVRVSGKKLEELALRLLGGVPAPRLAVRAIFRGAAGEPIDDGIALFFPAPASYTGEDVLELQGHGGPVVLGMILRRCLELGARLAEPGEFTRRAFLNDKLDLAQAEAVADLIDAATEAAARCALRSLRGEFSEVIGNLEKQLVEQRSKRATRRCLGSRVDKVGYGFGLREIELVIQESATRKFSGLGEACAKLQASPQDHAQHHRSPVTLELKHIFAGIGRRCRKEKRDAVVDRIAGSPAENRAHRQPRRRYATEQS